MTPSDTPAGSAGYKLAEHISAMADDAYFVGHPEWESLVEEALEILKAAHPEQNGGSVEDTLAKLRARMEQEEDIKCVVRLEPVGDRFRYLIETPFVTFPKFVIGTTDAEFCDVRIESKCGLLETAEAAWERKETR